MGNYENLKQSITEVIRTNGNKEITGAVLQNTLLTIISTVGANATFAGIATPTTNPGTPDGPVFYLASESGTYTNFGAIELQDGLSVLMWNGSWSSQQVFSVDDVPTAGSDNLVKSGGVYKKLTLENSASWENGYYYDSSHQKAEHGSFTCAELIIDNYDSAVITITGTGASYCYILDSNDNVLWSQSGTLSNFILNISNYTGAHRLLVSGRVGDVHSAVVFIELGTKIKEVEKHIDNQTIFFDIIERNSWNDGFYDINQDNIVEYTAHNGLQSAIYNIYDTIGTIKIENADQGAYSSINIPLYIFVNEVNVALSNGKANGIVTIPEGATKLIINSIPNVKDDIVITHISSVKEQIQNLNDEVGYPIIKGVWETGYYYSDTYINPNPSFVHTSFKVDNTIYTKLKVTLNITASISLNCYLLDENDNIIENWKSVKLVDSVIDLSSYSTPVKRILLSSGKDINYSAELIPKTINVESLAEEMEEELQSTRCNRTVYVDSSYSGDMDGTFAKPFISIIQAINNCYTKGCCLKVFVKSGEYLTDFNINLDQFADGELQILNYGDGKVVCGRRNVIINDGSETLVGGKEKTYQISITNSLFATTGCLWQYGYPYGDIPVNSRHPLQRGYSHRLNSTPIVKCMADNVSDAISEIENADNYKFYYDSVNGVLYFSRPGASDEYNIVQPRLYDTFINGARNVKLSLCGIDIEFCALSLDYCNLANISDCSIRYANARGGLRLDHCRNSVITRVEVAGTYQGITTMGDGINIHSDTMGTISDEEQRTTNTIIDCWCHDNNDDGYSDHEGCQTTIIGGLFEYNKKGGCTPSTGAVDTIYNAISRNNYNGFYYINNPSDGGVGGQMILFNCLAENNSECGFRVATNANNVATLINCSSIGNTVGYNSENGVLKAIGCTTLNDTTAKDGTITIETPNALS